MVERIDKKSLLQSQNAHKKDRVDQKDGVSFKDEISKIKSQGTEKNIPVEPKGITLTQAIRLAQQAPFIKRAAARHNVPVELICGVILQESGGHPRRTSPKGAQGLMQLMPGTAKRFGVKNSFDPAQNIEAGTKYLRFLLDKFNGDVKLALAGYNAGEGNVMKYGNKIPPFKETRNYVPSVLSYTQGIINMLTASYRRDDLPSNAKRV